MKPTFGEYVFFPTTLGKSKNADSQNDCLHTLPKTYQVAPENRPFSPKGNFVRAFNLCNGQF